MQLRPDRGFSMDSSSTAELPPPNSTRFDLETVDDLAPVQLCPDPHEGHSGFPDAKPQILVRWFRHDIWFSICTTQISMLNITKMKKIMRSSVILGDVGAKLLGDGSVLGSFAMNQRWFRPVFAGAVFFTVLFKSRNTFLWTFSRCFFGPSGVHHRSKEVPISPRILSKSSSYFTTFGNHLGEPRKDHLFESLWMCWAVGFSGKKPRRSGCDSTFQELEVSWVGPAGQKPRRLKSVLGWTIEKTLEEMMPLSEFNGISWTIFQSAKARMTGQLGCCGYILLQLRR